MVKHQETKVMTGEFDGGGSTGQAWECEWSRRLRQMGDSSLNCPALQLRCNRASMATGLHTLHATISTVALLSC